ncbi:MAG: ATP-binding cassette domain-containing protein [Actinomycetota bacterium]|nr:ATP-binding cassette domain-containing protein [Actinomycetota bacterium]
MRIDVEKLTTTLRDGTPILDDVTFSVQPGEMVAIVGGSGAGKTTLLEAMAGTRIAERGTVRFDGVDAYERLDEFRSRLGFVPQDDIIHAELPLERTLRYAAMLRLPDATAEDLDQILAETLRQLDLSDRGSVRVGALSGGQRKRASIAVELLTSPHVFFLDEPTSGLDPTTSAELMRLLRHLAHGGTTVVFTTHSIQDLQVCDRIVFLASGGRLAFAGTPDEAHNYFRVETLERVYERLATEDTPQAWASRFGNFRTEQPGPEPPPAGEVAPSFEPSARRRAGPVRQWFVLTRRTAETLARNRLTLAILLGSPVMVVAMFAVLFRSGAFDFGNPSPTSIIMIIFWVAFGGFFFGLTYGLLQICTEVAIVRRERLVGLNLASYIASKITVLLPFLLVVDVLMLGVLRALDRLPAASTVTYLEVGVTLALDAAAALALGLLTSAAVGNPSQATLALPMLCFPAVLFSGAILPVHVMAPVGKAISLVMHDRWAFEAIGHSLDVREIFAHGGSPLGPPLLREYGDAGTRALGAYWSYLVGFTLFFALMSWGVLERKCRTRGGRRRGHELAGETTDVARHAP